MTPSPTFAPTVSLEPAAAPHRPTTGARLALVAVRAYQLARSGRPSPCRFIPSCSQYAAEALARHGLRRGLALALRRLGRCHPGGPFGYDPVPE